VSALLEVEGLRVRLPTPAGYVTVVDGVDYRVEPAQVFGVAGESGSGKTVSMLALLGLLPAGALVEGRAAFGGKDLLRLRGRELRVHGADELFVLRDTVGLDPVPHHHFMHGQPPEENRSVSVGRDYTDLENRSVPWSSDGHRIVTNRCGRR